MLLEDPPWTATKDTYVLPCDRLLSKKMQHICRPSVPSMYHHRHLSLKTVDQICIPDPPLTHFYRFLVDTSPMDDTEEMFYVCNPFFKHLNVLDVYSYKIMGIS